MRANKAERIVLTKKDYVYAAILSHISWQQIGTGQVYRKAELVERIARATGVELTKEYSDDLLARLAEDNFADIIFNQVVGDYIKIKYKPINEHVAKMREDPDTPEYHYGIVGKRMLADLFGQNSDEFSDVENLSPPPSLSAAQAEKLVAELGKSIDELDSLEVDNETKAQARALFIAARSLADAPEPPVGLIWEILERLNNISGIASLLLTIFAVFA